MSIRLLLGLIGCLLAGLLRAQAAAADSLLQLSVTAPDTQQAELLLPLGRYHVTTSYYDSNEYDTHRPGTPPLLPHRPVRRAHDAEMSGLRDQRNVLLSLLDVYEQTERYDSAFAVAQLLREIEDSLSQRRFQKRLEEMEVRYANQEKELEIAGRKALLKPQRQLAWVLLLGGILLGAITLLYWRYYRQKRELAEVLTKHNVRLRELDRAKSTFFANISHEFRTPLTLIMGPLNEAIERIQEYSLREQLRMARRNAQQLLHLVEELLTLSRLEADRLEIHPVPTHLVPRLRRTVEAFRSLADQRKIELVTALPTDTALTVSVDWAQLEKIVNNLLGNALKFSPADSRIELAAEWHPADGETGTLYLQISDTGPGTPEAKRERIFEPYYQGNGSGTPLGGTGIGLAFARELATAMAGTLAVSPNAAGGSTFTLRLPLVRTSEVPEPFPVATARSEPSAPLLAYQSPASTERRSLLVIEDQPDMQLYLQHVLAPHFHVRTASNTRSAQALLERYVFDLVLSNLMLPGEDGIAFLERVRASQTVYRRLPFIIVTARTGAAERLDCLKLGVDDYLTKPFETEELIARIQNVLNNQRRRSPEESTSAEEISAAEQLVRDAEAAVDAHLADNTFGPSELAQTLGYSLRNLERRLKAQTGLSPTRFIHEIRLRAAYHLLERGQLATVSEVGLATGFASAAHFSRVFSRRYGVPPSGVLGRAEPTV